MPYTNPWYLPSFKFTSTKCIPLDMLKAGYATVYEQAGAEYGTIGVEKFLKVQQSAQ